MEFGSFGGGGGIGTSKNITKVYLAKIILMKFNDIDMKNWKESDINTDSLWVIGERDKSGKHKNVYHRN